MDIEQLQRKLCQKYNAQFLPLDISLKLGVADDFFSNKIPLNGFRHPPENGTSGWYLWAGDELSQDEDYFKPMHGTHLVEKRPAILEYLGLAPGWRFLVADDYVDIWFDETLFEI